MPALSYRLASYRPAEGGLDGGVAVYDFEHQTDGREGTCLAFEVRLKLVPTCTNKESRVEATIEFTGCKADTPAHALERLAGWLGRAAEAVVVLTSVSPLTETRPSVGVDVTVDAGALPLGTRLRLEKGESS